MYCWKCGKEISNTAEFCPHCGASQRRAEAPGMSGSRNEVKLEPDYHIMAIIGLVLSCISIGISLGGLMSVAGVVLSIIALVHINKLGLPGRGYAIGGIAVGGAVILVSLLLNIYYTHLGISMLHGLFHGLGSMFWT